MLEQRGQLQLDEQTPEHLRVFFAWQKTQLDRYRRGSNILVPADLELESMSRANRLARVDALVTQVKASPYAVFATAVHRLFMAAPTIFTGETRPLQVLKQDQIFEEFCAVTDSLEYADAVALLGHSNPVMRVLEVGAGTGGTTRKILQALTSSNGERLYSSYTYSDVSPGFLTTAQEQFADREGMLYAVFDITQDPATQGLELGQYDLIVASNVSDVNTQ